MSLRFSRAAFAYWSLIQFPTLLYLKLFEGGRPSYLVRWGQCWWLMRDVSYHFLSTDGIQPLVDRYHSHRCLSGQSASGQQSSTALYINYLLLMFSASNNHWNAWTGEREVLFYASGATIKMIRTKCHYQTSNHPDFTIQIDLKFARILWANSQSWKINDQSVSSFWANNWDIWNLRLFNTDSSLS